MKHTHINLTDGVKGCQPFSTQHEPRNTPECSISLILRGVDLTREVEFNTSAFHDRCVAFAPSIEDFRVNRSTPANSKPIISKLNLRKEFSKLRLYPAIFSQRITVDGSRVRKDEL